MNNYGHLVVALLSALVAGLLWNVAATAGAFTALRALGGLNPAFTTAFAPLALDVTLACIVALGAMLPDVDHPQTKIFKFALAVIFTTVAWLSLPAVGGNYLAAVGAGAIATLVAYLVKPRHRDVTHSWKAAIVYSLACALLTKNAGLALVALVSYASHLVADA